MPLIRYVARKCEVYEEVKMSHGWFWHSIPRASCDNNPELAQRIAARLNALAAYDVEHIASNQWQPMLRESTNV